MGGQGGRDAERGSFERGTFETHEGEQRQLRAGGRKKEEEVEVLRMGGRRYSPLFCDSGMVGG